MSTEPSRLASGATSEADAIIIGAGPAGLTAAIYLGRFRRRLIVLDAGQSRARWIPESHNIPGFAKGIGGAALLREFTAQALTYGARIVRGSGQSLTPIAGGFALRTSEQALQARFVLLATGALDVLPDVQGAEDAMRRGLLRMCPICDGYEAIDRDIAVIGQDQHAQREAKFLQTYSARVSLVYLGKRGAREARAQLAPCGIQVLEASAASLHFQGHSLEVTADDGSVRSFEVVYSALGCRARNALATAVGARTDKNEALLVSAHQETSVPGLYAAGDVVRGLSQVVVACAEAAIAATHMHNRLQTSSGP